MISLVSLEFSVLLRLSSNYSPVFDPSRADFDCQQEYDILQPLSGAFYDHSTGVLRIFRALRSYPSEMKNFSILRRPLIRAHFRFPIS